MIGYFYNIRRVKEVNKENKTQEILNNTLENNEIENIINIFLTLLSIYLFENKLKNYCINKINSNNNIYSKKTHENSYYLINKECFSNFKSLFGYEKIETFLDKYKLNIYGNIEDDILKIIKEGNSDYLNMISSKKKIYFKNIRK